MMKERRCERIDKIKRIYDFLIGIPLFFITLPLMLIVYLLVRIFMGKPVLFKQWRAGKNGKRFLIYKFRTMTFDTDKEGNLLPDEERITRLGKILRLTRLDELPQLINVIKGDLSLVGPRPVPVEMYENNPIFQGRRTCIRPGITGYTQIKLFNNVPWEEKVKYDLYYIEHWNLFLDLKIIILTPLKLFSEIKRNK